MFRGGGARALLMCLEARKHNITCIFAHLSLFLSMEGNVIAYQWLEGGSSHMIPISP